MSWKDLSPLETKYHKYKNRAERKKLPFELTINEFEILINGNCEYCGDNSGGIDRKDSSLGYTIDNSTPCCSMCNTMKFTYSTQDFLNHIDKIYKRQKGTTLL